MITPYRTIPRSVRELILRDLARQTRTPKAIADRHHVPVEAVTALRDHCGPGPVELLAHARQLLSSQDLRTCRAWALLTGRSSSRGPIARDVVTEWLRLGRPEAPTPVEAPSEPVEEEGAATPSAWEAPAVLAVAEAPAIAASVGSDMPVNNIPADVACAICDACGDALVADCCPACEAEGEQLAARRADDWDRFYGECLQVPALAEHCHAVAHAVERLRDARAEHEHRESLVQRVRAAIQPQGLHLTVEQVRLILAAVDEVA